MRVAMVGPTYPHRGGIVHYTHSLASALAGLPRTTVELHAFRKLFPRLLYKGSDYTGPQAMTLPPSVAVHRDLSYSDPFSWSRAARALKGADIAHFQVWTPVLAPQMSAVAKRARRSGAKLVATVHNVAPHERRDLALLPLSKRLLRLMDAVIVHGPTLADACHGRFGVERSLIHVVAHGPYAQFDLKRFTRAEARAKLSLPTDAIVVLAFGTLRDYKGLDVLMRAVAALPPRVHLLVAGEPWVDARPYVRLAEETGIASRTSMHLGYVPDDEVELFYRAADVVAMPYTRFEAQSGVALTGQAFGLPLVVTDVGALPELTHPELVVPHGDPTALAHAIGRAAETPPRPSDASWAQSAQRTRGLYESLLEGERTP